MLRLAIIYAFGSIKDHSINEYILNKIPDMEKSISKSLSQNGKTKVVIKGILPQNGLTEIYSILKNNETIYNNIVALGGSFVEGRFEAYNNERGEELGFTKLAVIDSRLQNRKTWFNEFNHAKPAGYLAAKICDRSKMNRVAFIGGASIPVVEKWNAGFKEGVFCYNRSKKKNIKISSEYLGPTAKSFQDEFTAFHVTKDFLKWEKPSVIMQVCGLASKGVLQAINEYKEEADSHGDRECFLIFADFAPNTKKRKVYKSIAFSVVRKLEKAISHWVCRSGDTFQADINESGFQPEIEKSGIEGPNWEKIEETIIRKKSFEEEWANACKECGCL